MPPPPNVGRRFKWFRRRCDEIAVGDTYDDVEYVPLLEREFLQVARIAVEEEGTAPTEIRLFITGHGYDHPVAEETSPAADTLYWVRWPTYLVAGEKLVARFYGATADDKLVMYLEGWIRDYPVPPPEGALGVGDALGE